MAGAPIVLVPGFWLGAWAWDEVAARLRTDGHDVTALTLPGLESVEADRSDVTFADHVAAIEDAVRAAGRPVVLVVHSGAGGPGHEVVDRVPASIATMVYLDTGAAVGPMDPDFDAVELPLPPAEQLAAEENLEGLTDAQLTTFRERAVPQPGATVREGPTLRNVARLGVPTTVVCTGFSADEFRDAVAQGYPFLAGLADLTDLTYFDLPTSHWPMWSRPDDLARILGDIATGPGDTPTDLPPA
jgi:pimeloyl-ACP methyl ester carboxylesterase